MTNLAPIPFYEDTLWAESIDPAHPVAVKPICETLCLSWHGQFERLKRDAVLSEGIRVIRIPSLGGTQETVCLPLNLIPGFLFGIDDSRIRDATIRDKVLRYKRECYGVLFQHFFGPKPATPPEPEEEDLSNIGALAEVNTRVRLVEVAERLSGKIAARALWRRLGLPEFEETHGIAAACGEDSLGLFVKNCIELAPDVITPSSLIYRAYAQYCSDENLTNMGQTRFYKHFARLGFTSRKSNGMKYHGIRVRGREERQPPLFHQ